MHNLLCAGWEQCVSVPLNRWPVFLRQKKIPSALECHFTLWWCSQRTADLMEWRKYLWIMENKIHYLVLDVWSLKGIVHPIYSLQFQKRICENGNIKRMPITCSVYRHEWISSQNYIANYWPGIHNLVVFLVRSLPSVCETFLKFKEKYFHFLVHCCHVKPRSHYKRHAMTKRHDPIHLNQSL